MKIQSKAASNGGSKALQEWEGKLDQILLDIRTQFLRLGKTLYEAKFCKDLSPVDYDQLLSYVETSVFDSP